MPVVPRLAPDVERDVSAKKSAGKSAKPRGRPFAKGENGGARGPRKGAPNAGRPRLEFADECRDLQRDVILAKAAATLRSPKLGPGDDAWEWAATWVSRYGHSDAARRVALRVEDAEALPDEVLDELIGDAGE